MGIDGVVGRKDSDSTGIGEKQKRPFAAGVFHIVKQDYTLQVAGFHANGLTLFISNDQFVVVLGFFDQPFVSESEAVHYFF